MCTRNEVDDDVLRTDHHIEGAQPIDKVAMKIAKTKQTTIGGKCDRRQKTLIM